MSTRSSNRSRSGAGGSPSEIDLTIQAELNKIKDVRASFPAANLLYALLCSLTINVNNSERNIHTSAQVVIRSNKLYDAIILAMDTLEKSNVETLEQNWSLFDSYTTVIPLLERILLNITNSMEIRSHAPPSTSTQDALIHIATWVADRNALKEALESLKQRALLQNVPTENIQLITADYVVHRRKDDDSTLRVLYDFIMKDRLTDLQIIQTGQRLVTDVKALIKDLLERLLQRPPSEELSGIVVRTVMTVYIPFAVLASPNTPVPWKSYLRTNEIWMALKDILTKVKAYIEKPQAASTLDPEFDKLEKLLLKLTNTTIETADEMLKLIKLAAYIHRPYSGRTATLVKTVYAVDQVSRKNTALVVPRHNLKQYMRTAVEKLTAIRTSPYDLNTFSLESQYYKDLKAEHEKLFGTTAPLYTSCEIPIAEWNKQNVAYMTAVTVDEMNVKDAQGKFNPAADGAK